MTTQTDYEMIGDLIENNTIDELKQKMADNNEPPEISRLLAQARICKRIFGGGKAEPKKPIDWEKFHREISKDLQKKTEV